MSDSTIPENQPVEPPDGLDIEDGDSKDLEAAKTKMQAQVLATQTELMTTTVKIWNEAPKAIVVSGRT